VKPGPRAGTPARAKTPPARAKTPPARAKTPGAKKAVAAGKPAPRADLGAPVDGFFARQPPALRAILEELRKLIEATAPAATSSIKWGMPFYTLGGKMMCALGAHRAHVNLILAGPPDAFADPAGILEGDGKTGRHLKLRTLDDLPRAEVRGWVRTAAALAAGKR
jgi:hypothetical protein